MCARSERVSTLLLLLVALAWTGSTVMADPLRYQVPKFQQRPMHGVMIGEQGEPYWGHDEWSTIYGSHEQGVYDYLPRPVVPPFEGGVYMADDFADPFDTPVLHVRWWGSYQQDFVGHSEGVKKFLITFETDVPDPDPLNPETFSHPGRPILNQVVRFQLEDKPLTPGSGRFTERHVPAHGFPFEQLYEYNAELARPFWQEPNTVYWLKIVALVDPDKDDEIIWGWHNRDYTEEDMLASRKPEVVPGEHIQGWVADPQGGREVPVWHFQDDAVMGPLEAVIRIETGPQDPCMKWEVIQQDIWFPQNYVVEFDGPPEIERYSKDLAFELFTIPELIPGDANMDGCVNDQDAAILATHWQRVCMTWYQGDFNHDGIVTDADAAILATYWQKGCPQPTPEPATVVLLVGGLASLLVWRRRLTL